MLQDAHIPVLTCHCFQQGLLQSYYNRAYFRVSMICISRNCAEVLCIEPTTFQSLTLLNLLFVSTIPSLCISFPVAVRISESPMKYSPNSCSYKVNLKNDSPFLSTGRKLTLLMSQTYLWKSRHSPWPLVILKAKHLGAFDPPIIVFKDISYLWKPLALNENPKNIFYIFSMTGLYSEYRLKVYVVYERSHFGCISFSMEMGTLAIERCMYDS